MSRLRELIDELCPDGVEYKPMSAAAVVMRTPKGVLRSHYGDGSRIPIIDQGQGLVVGYTDDDNLLLDFCDGCTVFGDHTREVKWVSFPFAVGADGVKVLRAAEDIEQKYLFYALSNLNIRSRGYNRHWSVVRDMSIPVPPIEVQREVVRVLDEYTAAHDELARQLKSEQLHLAKQYDALRMMLINECLSDVSCKTLPLGDVVRFVNGRAYKQEELLSEGKYRVLRVGNFFTSDSWYYSNLELPDDKYCDDGDLLYAWSASFGPRIWHGERTIYHYHIWKLLFDTNELDKEYLYHFLAYDASKIRRSNSVTQSTMMHVSMSSMKKREIIIPSIEDQRRIVDTLNAFENATNELASSLEERLSLQESQLRMVRDQLLSFSEKVA